MRTGKVIAAPVRVIRGRYDAAATNRDNARHWSQADFTSPDAEADAGVRRLLRARARYEVTNNSYARGIVRTLAHDCVGTGPRLQMASGDDSYNADVEQAFAKWSKRVRLAAKLRTMRMARCQDGEAFAILTDNPGLEDSPVHLDLQLVEADRVTDEGAPIDENSVDGVRFDAFGNPSAYRVLLHHPGGADSDGEAMIVPARSMIHLFLEERPGQHRGVPEIVSSLPLFAQLRRYTLAVLAAAESAADFAGILYTDAPANGTENVEAMDMIQLERNMLLTMPGGWKMSQVDAKQPAATYAEFKREILNEIARCVSMPFNVAAGNSSGYNYASGRLDHQVYRKAIAIDRQIFTDDLLDRLFPAWLREWTLVSGRTPKGDDHTWFWDGNEHVDPLKEASAQVARLGANTTTLAEEYARQGKDWEVEIRQRARELRLLKELGITQLEKPPATPEEDEDGRD